MSWTPSGIPCSGRHQRQRHGRRAEIGPGRAERRIAGRLRPMRRLARRRRRKERVVLVEHVVERSVERRARRDRAHVLDRRHARGRARSRRADASLS